MCTKKVIAFFIEVMHWSLGVEFHVCTPQVMLASILGGTTVHHLAGRNPFSSKSVIESNLDAHLASEPLQSRLLLCRVIYIDEVFTLSAQFLAEVESAVRNGVSETSPYNFFADGKVRLWGGINMGFVGDAYQLDCPEGTVLYKVPASFLPEIPFSAFVLKGDPPKSILASGGLELMWQCVQGDTELTVPYRCEDAWWNSVLNQIRVLQLSDEDYAFLHGTETTLPGSWLMTCTVMEASQVIHNLSFFFDLVPCSLQFCSRRKRPRRRAKDMAQGLAMPKAMPKTMSKATTQSEG